ncbi:lactate racemase domain-containing protein [Isoptericola sp. b441]|uniref:Lactate racemase domain-containing protein n=1 Tax=Actinotalea lenta TaxID=3064654 RepID=A0ABT9DAU0_9CELL|nr:MULTISPECIES: lactate racemase domain-containing protein [unclassified Isoptericola]MDO8108000.1 lactate racemase domain-containing protein [Isoptericola sp. b441]MDO8120330.1 lactate racemase domain-containing protein [Isoptericola sp. b490]
MTTADARLRTVPLSSIGGPEQVLEPTAVVEFVVESLDRLPLEGRSVCLVIPDGTRSAPLPLLLSAVHRALVGRVSRLTAVIALGTHQAMSEEHIAKHLGYVEGGLEATYPGMTVLNHEWWDPDTLVSVGRISAERVAELSEGRLAVDADVRLNRAVVEHDVALVVGPVFPHEVVGFSGGNKYFFPGIAGQEIIDLTHWVGALITSAEIIGTRGITPVRALIDEAASLIPSQRLALCVVAQSGSHALHAAALGTPEEAWAAAAAVSAETHVRYLDAPVRRVVSIIPEKYEDIWTAAKGFYKLEPVVADGGEVILYAPHVTEISVTHQEIYEIGYHCRDYFTKQWDLFKDTHWGVLAHSTHLRGAGTYDPVDGERCRLTVTLATRIPEDKVRRANLEYLDPTSVDLAAYEADPDTMVVPNAGEVLFRLR